MKFISVLALVASVSAVAIPDGGWNSWQNQCPPASTSYVTKYETQPAVTSYVTKYETQPAVTSYVTKYETKYETATVTAYQTTTEYQTKYETKYSTITAPCAQSSWGQWNNWGKSA